LSAEPAGLLDTSAFMARETKRAFGELPEHVAMSVFTIGELQLAVLSAHESAAWKRSY
jgi:predicted nucleic acid-binding protein